MQKDKEKKLEEKIVSFRILEAKLNSLLKQRDLVMSKLLEIESTLAGIGEIERGGEKILFPIGSEAYVTGKTVSEKMIIEIGANIALEKNIEETKGFLNKRKIELENVLAQIQKEILDTTHLINQLGTEIDRINKGR